jgi:hypothetical protein
MSLSTQSGLKRRGSHIDYTMASNTTDGTAGHALDLTVLGLNSGTSMVSTLF